MAERDPDALRSQFVFRTLPCTPPGIGEVPCPPGQPVGTPVDVFATAYCEGAPIPRDDEVAIRGVVNELTTSRPYYLYAVGTLGADWEPSKFVLFFGTSDDPGALHSDPVGVEATAIELFADETGVVLVSFGCVQGLAQRLADIQPTGFLLAPRTSPAPPATGSGSLPAARGIRGSATAVMAALVVVGAVVALRTVGNRRR